MQSHVVLLFNSYQECELIVNQGWINPRGAL